MKKTLQINLGGISFTIEEDAYQKLNSYLESIKKYFSSYEGSSEILEDIESRIAEKFYTKIQQGGIVEFEDVNKIVSSMGTVDDFESVKEEEDLKKETETEEKTEAPKVENNTSGQRPYSKYFRDGKRKALGGVLSGLANHFEIDVVWLRILFIIFAFGLIESGIGGFFFIAYLVAWIAMPQRDDLEENVKIKKLYRNPENKVLGGVATGLASYLNIDLVIIRVIFVIAGFFGIGILIYIIFWIVVPNANTLTQKMELQGQPLTIENIETTIKAKNESNPRQENSLTKLLLFPFRLIGIVISALGKLINPVGSILKILAGLLLLALGVTFGFSLIIALGVFFGIMTDNNWISGSHVLGVFANDIPQAGIFFAFLATFIPAVVLTVLGLVLITGKRFLNSNFWQTTLILWLVGIVGSATFGSKYAMNFSKNGYYETKNELSLPGNILILDSKDEYSESNGDFEKEFRENRIELKASDNNSFSLLLKYKAKGATKNEADLNTKNIEFKYFQKDSILTFDNYLRIKGKKIFRNQRVWGELFIPVNQKFKMTNRFVWNSLHDWWQIKDKYSIDSENVEKFTFIMKENNTIECLDCPQLTDDERDALRGSDHNSDFFKNYEFENIGEVKKGFDVKDFKEIEVGSNFFVEIKSGNEFKVVAASDNKEILDEIEAKVKGQTLEIEYKDSFRNHDEKVNLVITMPEITDLNLSGAANGKIYGFENLKKLSINQSGASILAIDINTDNLNIESSGASKILAKGQTNSLNLNLSGASEFQGRDLKASKASVDASGASQARLSKIPQLNSTTSGGSSVEKE